MILFKCFSVWASKISTLSLPVAAKEKSLALYVCRHVRDPAFELGDLDIFELP